MTGTTDPRLKQTDESDTDTNAEESETTVEDLTGTSDESEELSLNVIFHTLKNSRRRHVLAYLNQNGGKTTLSKIAEHIAAIENDVPEEQLTSTQRKRVYVGLYQCHLPKMDDVGVIEYDQPRGDIELTDKIEDFEEYLNTSDEEKTVRQWPYYYGAISGAGLVMLLVAVVLGLSEAVFIATSVATVGLVIACAGLHWRTERSESA